MARHIIVERAAPAPTLDCIRCGDALPDDLLRALSEPNARGHQLHRSGALVTAQHGHYCGGCATSVQSCRKCGCTDEAGCPDLCYWVERDLCSSCAGDIPEVEL